MPKTRTSRDAARADSCPKRLAHRAHRAEERIVPKKIRTSRDVAHADSCPKGLTPRANLAEKRLVPKKIRTSRDGARAETPHSTIYNLQFTTGQPRRQQSKTHLSS